MNHGELARATPIHGSIRNPATGRRLRAEGEIVTVDTFWIRREIDGSVRLEAATDSGTTPTTTDVTTDSEA